MHLHVFSHKAVAPEDTDSWTLCRAMRHAPFPVFKKLTGWALQLVENKKRRHACIFAATWVGQPMESHRFCCIEYIRLVVHEYKPKQKKSACSVAGDHTWHTGSTANVPALLGEPSFPVLPSNTLYFFWQEKALLDVNFRTPSMSRPPGIMLGNSRQNKSACLLLNDQRRNWYSKYFCPNGQLLWNQKKNYPKIF